MACQWCFRVMALVTKYPLMLFVCCIAAPDVADGRRAKIGKDFAGKKQCCLKRAHTDFALKATPPDAYGLSEGFDCSIILASRFRLFVRLFICWFMYSVVAYLLVYFYRLFDGLMNML